MALVLESKTLSNSGSGYPVAATKPTGLAEGDLMVAQCSAALAGGGTESWSAPAGWTTLGGHASSNGPQLYVFAKIAEAADVAASTFSFNCTDNNGIRGNGLVALYRISATIGFTSVAANIEYSGGILTEAYSGTGVTTTDNNGMLMVLIGAEQLDDGANFTSYAVANNNPTWTEQYDTYYEPGGVSVMVASATADYPYAQATGNFSFSDNDGDFSQVGAGLLSIIEDKIRFESVETATGGSQSVTVTKPTGLEVGDMLVAHLVSDYSGVSPAGATWATPSGWTSLYNTAPDAQLFTSVKWKIADSSDVAASDFTFTNDTGASADNGAALYRIANAAGYVNYATANTVDSNFSSIATTGLTPYSTNGFLMIFVASEQNGSSGWGGYAIATDDPTWTEGHDLSVTGTVRMAGAYAFRPEQTATGNASATAVNDGAGGSDANISIVSFISPDNVFFEADPLIMTSTMPAVTITGDANVSTTPITISGTVPDATITTTDLGITNKSKNSATNIVSKSKS